MENPFKIDDLLICINDGWTDPSLSPNYGDLYRVKSINGNFIGVELPKYRKQPGEDDFIEQDTRIGLTPLWYYTNFYHHTNTFVEPPPFNVGDIVEYIGAESKSKPKKGETFEVLSTHRYGIEIHFPTKYWLNSQFKLKEEVKLTFFKRIMNFLSRKKK